jgi:DNA-directed RNA polymerase subunit L
VTGTCSYGATPDKDKIKEQLEIRKQVWKDEGKSKEEIDFLAKNWVLLEGMRYVKDRSYDFILESVGIYENTDIIIKACEILLSKFEALEISLKKDEVEIKASASTMENSYDVTLENEDYTIGNILNHILYSVFYRDLKVLEYTGFKKLHPHDSNSILRICLTDKTKGISEIKNMLQGTISEAKKKLNSIKGCFDGSRK